MGSRIIHFLVVSLLLTQAGFGLSTQEPRPGRILVFPQFVAGGGMSAELLITNPGLQRDVGTIRFFNSTGSPVSLQIGGSEVSSVEYSVPPHGSQSIRTEPTGPAVVGYAVLQSTLPHSLVSSVVAFKLGEQIEAAVSASPLTTRANVFVEENDTAHTGVAVVNLNSTELELDLCWRRQDGTEIVRKPVQLPAGAQLVKFIPEIFDQDLKQNGSLHIHSRQFFSVVSLRQRSSGVLTAIPGSGVSFPQGGSQLLFMVDLGVDMTNRGFTEAELAEKTVKQLLRGMPASIKDNPVEIQNTNQALAVTVRVSFINQTGKEVLKYLYPVSCGQTIVMDPAKDVIPRTNGLSGIQILFGDWEQSTVKAADIGTGRFIVSVMAVGRSTDGDEVADLLFPWEHADPAGCGKTAANTGKAPGYTDSNLYLVIAQPISFDYLLGRSPETRSSSSCFGDSVAADTGLMVATEFSRSLVEGTPLGSLKTFEMPAPLTSNVFGIFDQLAAKTCDSRAVGPVLIFQYREPEFVLWRGRY